MQGNISPITQTTTKKNGLIVTVFEPLLHQASHRQIKDLLVTSIAGKHNNQTEKNKIKNYSLHEI